jgi:hypothetical protein
MELDSLKDIWKNLDEEDVRPESDAQIAAMLQKRSHSPIAKMKRNLRWELIAVLVLYSLTIWYYITAWEGRYWEVALLLFIVGIFFLFYYYRKNKLLKDMQCVACEVKSNLQRQLATLEKYVNFYFITGTLLTPIAYFVAGLIVFFKTPERTGDDKQPIGPQVGDSLGRGFNLNANISDHRSFVLFIVVGIVLTISIYFLNRWYVNRLYGQHIKKLKYLVHQMEETE